MQNEWFNYIVVVKTLTFTARQRQQLLSKRHWAFTYFVYRQWHTDPIFFNHLSKGYQVNVFFQRLSITNHQKLQRHGRNYCRFFPDLKTPDRGQTKDSSLSTFIKRSVSHDLRRWPTKTTTISECFQFGHPHKILHEM